MPSLPIPLIPRLTALQFVAFGWRINREIPLGDQGRRTWLPLPDCLNMLSLFFVVFRFFVVFSCIVLPLTWGTVDKLANAALSAGYCLVAFHGVTEAAHYRLFSRSARSIYLKTPGSDFPWITGQEIVSVSISLLGAIAAGMAAVFSK